MLEFLGAVVGAGASLIGGNKNRKAAKEANEANRPVNQVREWEEAGINPIMGITQGQWIPHQAVSMGDAFAAAGGQIARGLELQHQEDLKETELKKQNEELRKQLDNVAMRGEPSYMSQYGGLVPLPDQGGGYAQQRISGTSDPHGGGSAGFEVVEDRPSVVAGPDRRGWIRSAPGAAEQGENDYGEIGGELIGLDTLWSDLRGNYGGYAFDPQFGWEFRWPRPKLRPDNLFEEEQEPEPGWMFPTFGDGWMNEKFN